MSAALIDRSSDRRRALAADCAARLVDVAPLVMRRVRARMRREMPDLTVPQFRALVYVGAHRGCALRELAGHLGNTPATTSALVDRLVRRGWVSRATDAANRRQVRLALTARGADRLSAAEQAARREIAQAIADTPVSVLLSVRSGLAGLRERFVERRLKEDKA
jgi:DNA-binding MarR family transcriptional regulator